MANSIEPYVTLQPYETIVLNTQPHPKYFLTLHITFSLSTLLWCYTISTLVFNIPIHNIGFWAPFVVITTTVTTIIYILSESIISNYKLVLVMSYVWLLLLIIALTLISLQIIHIEIKKAYPEVWWEEHVKPFSLVSTIFCVTALLISNILWKVGSLVSKVYSFPLYVTSASLLLLSVYILLFPIEFLWRVEVRTTLFIMFSVVIMIYSGFLLFFIKHRGGLWILMTNRRIVVIQTFLRKDVREYYYDRIHDIKVTESFIGKKYNFGDLTLTLLTTVTEGQIAERKLSIHGICDPILTKNTISALSIFLGESKDKDKDKEKTMQR